MLELLLLVLLNNSHDFAYFAKEYGNSPAFIVGFRETKKYSELNKGLINANSAKLKFFLNMIKKDIDTFESLNSNNKKIVSNFLNKLEENDSSLLFPKNNAFALRKEIYNNHKNCIGYFGEMSFFDLTVSTNIIATKMFTDRENDYTIDIDNLFARFEKSDWKGSPLLASIILVQCNNLEYKKRYDQLLVNARKAHSLMKEISLDENDDLFTNTIRFEISALSKSRRHKESTEFFNKVGKKVLQSSRQLYGLAKIYSSAADSYFELGKFDLGESYQELALSKMHQFYLDLGNPEVMAEAKKLYKMLEKRGKKEEMIKIEARYNLKKHP